MMMNENENLVIQIGLSLESISLLQQQQLNNYSSNVFGESSLNNNMNSNSNSSLSLNLSPPEIVSFGQKMAQSFIDYVMSFEKKIQISMGKYESVIPTEVVKKWYNSFLSKIQKDPNFWKEKQM